MVILCGGQGTRLREETEYRPKPMVEIGPQPILWHIMKIYGAHGLDRFVLCLGYKGWEIKQYFLRYKEMHCDFTVAMDGSRPLEIHNQDGYESWRVTCAETGAETATGARLWRVKRYVDDAPTFCLTYGDAVGNVDIDKLLGVPLGPGAARHRHRRPPDLALRRDAGRRPQGRWSSTRSPPWPRGW